MGVSRSEPVGFERRVEEKRAVVGQGKGQGQTQQQQQQQKGQAEGREGREQGGSGGGSGCLVVVIDDCDWWCLLLV